MYTRTHPILPNQGKMDPSKIREAFRTKIAIKFNKIKESTTRIGALMMG